MRLMFVGGIGAVHNALQEVMRLDEETFTCFSYPHMKYAVSECTTKFIGECLILYEDEVIVLVLKHTRQ